MIPVTNSEGERVYCHLEDEQPAQDAGIGRKREALLSEPITALLEDVENEAYQRAVAASTAGRRV